MKKITICNLKIYKIGANSKDTDEFQIDNFSHYPLLIKENGELWKYGNLYLLSKIKDYKLPSHKTLDSISYDLKLFYEFCQKNNIDYLIAPRKIMRPTYQYREYLSKLWYKKQISPATIKKRMSSVIGFYQYLIEVERIYFKFPLWEPGIASISFQSIYGSRKIKQVETKDLLKVPHIQTDDFESSISDGGRLHPLEYNIQISLLKALKNIGNPEMTFGFLLSLVTGARIQTVFTLRTKYFEKNPSQQEKEIRVTVGPGTGCDTKNDKRHTLLIPTWLYLKIQIYIKSERHKKRLSNSDYNSLSKKDHYLFLTNRGNPYYFAKDDKFKKVFANPATGDAVRQFIAGQLKKELKKEDITLNFSFHDMRATYGMNLFDYLSKKNKIMANPVDILNFIRDRMGHESIITTQNYLNYRKNNKIKKEIQIDYEEYMQEILDV